MRDPSFTTLAVRMRKFAKGHINEDELIACANRLESVSNLSALRPRNVRLAHEFLIAYNEARKLYTLRGGGRYDI